MDGKLLILCDELPGDYKGCNIRDIYFLRSPIIDPDEDSDRLFVCWDAIIPQDQTFINDCVHYGMTYERMPVGFSLRQTGMTDGKHGSIKGSIQEDCYINAVETNIEILRRTKQKGGDVYGESQDLAVQFPLQANQRFLEAFTTMLNHKGVVRILVAHKNTTNPDLIAYRTRRLEAWQMQNEFMENKSCAKLLEPMMYDDFGEVLSRSTDEIMEVYSLPMFGEEEPGDRKPN